MMVTSQNSIEDVVRSSIQNHIDKSITDVVEKHRKEAILELEIKIREAVLSVSVTLSRMINVKGNGDTLEIRLIDDRPFSDGKKVLDK